MKREREGKSSVVMLVSGGERDRRRKRESKSLSVAAHGNSERLTVTATVTGVPSCSASTAASMCHTLILFVATAADAVWDVQRMNEHERVSVSLDK